MYEGRCWRGRGGGGGQCIISVFEVCPDYKSIMISGGFWWITIIADYWLLSMSIPESLQPTLL